ncbi:HHL087Cp [Eremothecium sinecaudum]|uniref:Dolichyl-diphosphooligosaccharide-protein glycosyltransferase subunit OST5 n=1 Tax=Eremothecium sinecaudum TaxID=45286 RepID=A0A109V103_9SACH|nr:HHL087Cp [Eremothecium sinecaudum]AMD22683.1 HHL087Cp [Eremothecium sinecaudum]
MFNSRIYKEYKESSSHQDFISLDRQPYYAAMSLILSIVFITAAVIQASRSKGFSKLQIGAYLTYAGLGSVLFGIATVFMANSFGVYV